MATTAPVKRIELGSELRKLRERRNLNHVEAASIIKGSASKVSRLEGGRLTRPKRSDIDKLLAAYGASEAEQQRVLALLSATAEAPWWQPLAGVLPGWFTQFLGLEQGAARVSTYENLFMPGLLQTRAYAESITLSGGDEDDETAQMWLDTRMRRRRLLLDSNAPQYHAIVAENAFNLDIGNSETMRDQVAHIIEMAQMPNVTVQIMGNILDVWSAHARDFTIFDFDADMPSVAYFEALHGGIFVEREKDVQDYRGVFENLINVARSESESLRWLQEWGSK